MSSLVYLIPAYQPSEKLLDVVRELRLLTSDPVLVVDDGSRSECLPIFEAISPIEGVTVLRHAVKLGKGAALKTAFNHALVSFPKVVGAVTLDADGQHRPEDAVRVGEVLRGNPDRLVLGCRTFSLDHDVPLRSRFGNELTRQVFRVLTGVAVSDTQTGLRGVPSALMTSMLGVSTSGYDFETDMLIMAARKGQAPHEVPIATIYLDGNSSSHFNPLLDSIRIYFVFVRFAFASIATATLDFVVFALAHWFLGNLLAASIAGRAVAGTFNFLVSKRFVFQSHGRVVPEAIRYAALVAFFLFLSNAAISVLVRRLGANVYLAKVLAETSLFLLSFAAQRLVVFPTSRPAAGAESTDWDSYYQKPFKTASITRKITTRRIVDSFRQYGAALKEPTVLELGGGNSCVYGAVTEALRPRQYLIVDNNRTGLNKFTETYPQASAVELIEDDVLDLQRVGQKADICFSIGLIEHFSRAGTKRAIKAHFDCVHPDGLVLITFPTPTWLYRVTRGAAEVLRLWKFPDERPCTIEEVVACVEEHADIQHCSIIWPIFLTQVLVVARSKAPKAINANPRS